MKVLTVALALSTAIVSVAAHSTVPGKAFNRFVTIWLENTDYSKAAGDENLQFLAKKGITLSNYFSVTHPSQPNYIASVSGDYYGINHDDETHLPKNISTVADLLDDKRISWGEYQEDMPSTGFQGFQFLNPQTKANMYVRKHNPLVIHNSVALDAERLARIKNTTLFQEDLKAQKLPQWMFITPNMTSDGHDTSVTVAGVWTRNFLEPLLTNEYFMKDTLILVTFDENHTFPEQNRVFSFLLGGAVPQHLVGTVDDAYYDHYSEIATVSANWGLHNLGRYDAGANVFSLVAKKTGDKVRTLPVPISTIFNNESYAGPFNEGNVGPAPVPNVSLKQNGRTILPAIKAIWGSKANQSLTVYHGDLEIPTSANPPK